jgi:hypothetical protein
MTLAEFSAKRRQHDTQFFECPGAARTVMVCSHIWWSDHLALAFYNAGFNVLISMPFYLLYTNEEAFKDFDRYWNEILDGIKQFKVGLIIGGNTCAMAPHPKSGQMLHDAVGLPVVNFWWDEPRTTPPFARRGVTPDDYLRCLRNDRTLNVIWDLDVLEELQTFLNLENGIHVPLATLPEFWPSGFIPIEKRPLPACFLGNCHYVADWLETDPDPLSVWARSVIDCKQNSLSASMRDCMQKAGPAPMGTSKHSSNGTDPWGDFCRPWEFLNSVWMHRTRNIMVKAAFETLRGKLALIGKNWDKMGLRANSEHAGENSGMVYLQSQASLNLFGGCVHSGMPLRPFDIGASGGLIVTHFQRELPDLFEPGKECLAFHTKEEMIELLTRVHAHPAEFNDIALAGRRRVVATHTWGHRVQAILRAVEQRFGWGQ